MWVAPKGYEKALGPAIAAGMAVHGDEIVMKPTEEYHGPEGDGGIIMGVVKREILWDHREKGVPLLYYDKGYIRDRAPWGDRSLPAWWRMCWNGTHPTDYLMAIPRPADRWEALKVPLAERQWNEKGHILILGSSAKFHHTERLDHPTQWTRALVKALAHHTGRLLVYRPKPSWAAAEAVDGADFDHGQKTPVDGALKGAWCSITYGSIACVDSVLAGIPCVVLGNGVARDISSNFVKNVLIPHWASRAEREQWAANLAYSNFCPAEIQSGAAWKILKEQLPHAV